MSLQNITDLVTIRPMTTNDINFLLDSSLKSLSKYTDTIFKGMTTNNLFSHLEFVVLYSLRNAEQYSVFIASHREQEDNIIAYIVADPSDNHVLLQYTKYSYRKLGIQKDLLMPLVIDEVQPIKVNWATKEMLKLAKVGRVEIVNRFVDKLIKQAL